MSRSNHYRLCDECTAEGLCEFHAAYFRYKHKPIRTIVGRRTWNRKSRYPRGTYKRALDGPPRWWWQMQHARVRAVYRQMMQREEDPVLPKERRMIDLWCWY